MRSSYRAGRVFQEEIVHEGERFEDGLKRRTPSRARRRFQERDLIS